jgi:act minimal PKS ketosynthase (KS/KS alpha)
MNDSGLDETADPHRVGVSLGSAIAASTSLEREYLVLSDSGKRWTMSPDQLTPQMFDYMVPSIMPAEIARAVGAEGPVVMMSAGCTSGMDSVGHGAALIREGSADVVLAGATDAPITCIVPEFDAAAVTWRSSPATPRHDHLPWRSVSLTCS